jgi:hypothetical protein
MKLVLVTTAFLGLLSPFNSNAQTSDRVSRDKFTENKQLVNQAQQVKFVERSDHVMKAHTSDTTGEKLFEANFIKYWVDEKEGRVYHVSLSPDIFDDKRQSSSCRISKIGQNQDAKLK